MLAALPACVFAQQGATDPDDAKVIPLDQQNLFDDREVLGPNGLGPDPTMVRARPNQGFDILPVAPLTSEQQKMLQHSVDNQKNWTLLTPEEILNVPTMQKILGIPDSDDDGNKLTRITERFSSQTAGRRCS